MTTIVLALARLAWISLPLTAAPLIGAGLADASRPVQVTGTVAVWLGWFAGTVALLVPTAAALTALRLLAPFAPVLAVAAAIRDGGSAGTAAIGLLVSVIATVLAFSGEVGRRFVQGSSYGAEERFPLRPPTGLAFLVLPILWAVAAAALVIGVLSLAARGWVLGGLLTVVAVVGWVLFVPRCHRLTRRFAVFVPAGFVLHDPLVLADTAMFPKRQVAGFAFSAFDPKSGDDPDAPADLTGGAVGAGMAFHLVNVDTVVLAASLPTKQTRAIHVRSGRFVPTRPGAFAAYAASQRYAVAMPPASTRSSASS